VQLPRSARPCSWSVQVHGKMDGIACHARVNGRLAREDGQHTRPPAGASRYHKRPGRCIASLGSVQVNGKEASCLVPRHPIYRTQSHHRTPQRDSAVVPASRRRQQRHTGAQRATCYTIHGSLPLVAWTRYS
jgi:hypothetical protein